MSETEPEENNSLSASTSLVMRVISRPTGLRSKKESERLCRWLEHIRAHVIHHALADDAEQVVLEVAQAKANAQRQQEDHSDQQYSALPLADGERRRPFGRDVVVNRHLREEWREQIDDDHHAGKERGDVDGALVRMNKVP